MRELHREKGVASERSRHCSNTIMPARNVWIAFHETVACSRWDCPMGHRTIGNLRE